MSVVRAAVIGTGFGTRIHVPGLRLAGAEVVAISSRHRARAEDAARTAEIPAAYDDHRVMLDELKPSLVTIATPPATHLELVRDCADRGIHVICEKPLAYDAAEAWEMVSLANSAGIVHATDFQFRYWPGRERFHSLVRSGLLGELQMLRYVWTAPMRTDPANPPFNWFAQEEQGGGVLYNLGSHFIDFVRWCFGEVESATGALHAFVPERPLPGNGEMQRVTSDDTASTEMVLESGALVSAQYGFITAGRRIGIEAYGSRGTLVLDDDNLLFAGRGQGALESVAVPPAEPPDPKPLAPFVLLAKDAISRITGTPDAGAGTFPTFVDGARTQEIIDAIRLGARDRTWRNVERRDHA